MMKNQDELFFKRVIAVMAITSLLSLGNASARYWKNESEINQIMYFQKIAPRSAVVSTNIAMFWCHLSRKYDLRVFPNSWDNSDFVVVKQKHSRFRGENYAPDKDFDYLLRLNSDRRFSIIWNEYNKSLRTKYIIYRRNIGFTQQYSGARKEYHRISNKVEYQPKDGSRTNVFDALE